MYRVNDGFRQCRKESILIRDPICTWLLALCPSFPVLGHFTNSLLNRGDDVRRRKAFRISQAILSEESGKIKAFGDTEVGDGFSSQNWLPAIVPLRVRDPEK
jgi:hypothetical protein